MVINMEKIKMKTKINQLFRTYPGKKMEKYEALATDLRLRPRIVMHYLKGEVRPNFYVAREIEALLALRTGGPKDE